MGLWLGHWHLGMHFVEQTVSMSSQVRVHGEPHSSQSCPPGHGCEATGSEVGESVAAFALRRSLRRSFHPSSASREPAEACSDTNASSAVSQDCCAWQATEKERRQSGVLLIYCWEHGEEEHTGVREQGQQFWA